ncbi:MAG: Flp pilus assembly complex ATPase component TadA [Oscillospiraceae bacterium]|nr:Flp pilus assembly complex ATPase component TadA [Oscillospiraceae bacterium]
MDFNNLINNLGSVGNEIIKHKIPYEEILEIYISIGQKAKIYTSFSAIEIGTERITEKELSDIFAALCEYSVHTYKKEICEGYITVSGGIRIGICGTAIYDEDKIVGIKHISALNIRIPHEIKGIADKISNLYDNRGILLIGPPCSGKTTMLRDISRKLSLKHRVVIIDERSEISGTFHGIPGFEIGNSAVMDGFIKSDGMIRAIRAMSPEIIICDEFGETKDIESAMFSMKSGAQIIASIHAADKNDFIGKVFSDKIIKSGIFEHFVFLNKKFEVYKIMSKEELIA